MDRVIDGRESAVAWTQPSGPRLFDLKGNRSDLEELRLPGATEMVDQECAGVSAP